MAGQAFLVEHSPLWRRSLFWRSLGRVLPPALAVHKIALLWVFRDVLFLFLVDLFQFGFEVG